MKFFEMLRDNEVRKVIQQYKQTNVESIEDDTIDTEGETNSDSIDTGV